MWRHQRNLPSLVFLPPHCSMAPAASLPSCKHTAASPQELVAGGDGRCSPNQAPERGNSGQASMERCFFCISTMRWFGGLAASLKREGFLGPPLNIHLLVKKTAQLKLPALFSCQSGGPPSQKLPLLDQIAVARTESLISFSACLLL